MVRLSGDLLKDKLLLVVDDEPDVLETVKEQLSVCVLHTAADYETAIQFLMGYTYDAVILDVMGVRGFDLLKVSVRRGFPTIILTAHAVTPDALKTAIKLGAVSFLPKEQMAELHSFLEEVVLEEGKPLWRRLFLRLGKVFDKRFGPGWKERDAFFKEFVEKLESEGKET